MSQYALLTSTKTYNIYLYSPLGQLYTYIIYELTYIDLLWSNTACRLQHVSWQSEQYDDLHRCSCCMAYL